MDTMTMLRAQICSNCGDQLGTFGEEPAVVGRCCTNLPLPWGMDNETGRYGRQRGFATLGADHDEDGEDEEIEDQRPRCFACGSMRFEVHEYERVYYTVDASDEDDLEDGMLYIPAGHGERATDRVVVQCRDCGFEHHGEHEWS